MEIHRIRHALFLLPLMAVVISACSPQAVQGDETQIAATGLAFANGMLTSTRAAETPRVSTRVPTPVSFGSTPVASPSASAAATVGVPVTGGTAPAATSMPVTAVPATQAVPVTGGATSTTTSVCNQTLNETGPTAQVLIKNNTNNKITLTIGTSVQNSLGQCGFLSWSLVPPNSTVRGIVPQTQNNLGDSCYWAYGVINAANHQTVINNVVGNSTGGNAFCINNSKRWVIAVNPNRIRLIVP